MSSYLNIYIRGLNDEVVMIGSYSRSSTMYQVFNDNSVYGTSDYLCEPLTQEKMSELLDVVRSDISDYKAKKKKEEENKYLLGNWNNSVEEKVEHLSSIDSMIDYYEEEIGNLQHVENTLIFLRDIMELYYTHEDAVLYVGIDCPKPKFVDGNQVANEQEEEY